MLLVAPLLYSLVVVEVRLMRVCKQYLVLSGTDSGVLRDDCDGDLHGAVHDMVKSGDGQEQG